MRTTLTRAKALVAAGAVALASATMVIASTGVAGAASPSDPTRADFHSGNIVNCAQAGFPNSTTAFASGTSGINQDGIVGTTTGGTTANIATPLPAGIVIQAVVMKGGPAYNVYRDGSGSVPDDYTPSGPANADGLDSPQNYISPLNGGGNIPTISHWFICYTGGETPPPPNPEPGNLVVKKAVTGADTVPGAVAATFQVHVTCDDGTDELINLPADGTEVKVTGITAGSFCTVLETTPTLPAGFTGTIVVTYSPTIAENNGVNDGVQIPEGEDSDPVTITNSYAGVQVEAANVVAVQPTFTG
jgi:hypothetical protein